MGYHQFLWSLKSTICGYNNRNNEKDQLLYSNLLIYIYQELCEEEFSFKIFFFTLIKFVDELWDANRRLNVRSVIRSYIRV